MRWDEAVMARAILATERQRIADQRRLDVRAARLRVEAAKATRWDSAVRVLTSCIRFGWWWPGED